MGTLALPVRFGLNPALALAAAALFTIAAVAANTQPGVMHAEDTVLLSESGAGDMITIFARNLLVLGLSAMVCWMKVVHLRQASTLTRIGYGYVAAVAAGAALWQISTLGTATASLAFLLDRSPWLVTATLLPHALLELTAMLLPVALLTRRQLCSDHRRLDQGLRAALPVAAGLLMAAAFIEVVFSPLLFNAA